jgi:hypothetical protein
MLRKIARYVNMALGDGNALGLRFVARIDLRAIS